MCTIDLLHKNLTRVYICTQDFNKLITTKLKKNTLLSQSHKISTTTLA